MYKYKQQQTEEARVIIHNFSLMILVLMTNVRKLINTFLILNKFKIVSDFNGQHLLCYEV